MAMGMDFWKDKQQFNMFRTKPCQRLNQNGVCDWKSQCQFSHCPGWPRRAPNGRKYSPEICPHIQKTQSSWNGAVQIKNCCTAGLSCQYAHSKEEILFHPQMFKTILCEEFQQSALSGDKKNRSQSGDKKNKGKAKKCHRYYCPFAHGKEELHDSDIPEIVRRTILSSLDMFPSDVCCNACTFPFKVARVPPQLCAPTIEELENMPQMRTPTIEAPPLPQRSGAPWQFGPSPRAMPPWQSADSVHEHLRRLQMLPSDAYGHEPFPRARYMEPPHKIKDKDDTYRKSLGNPAFVKFGNDGFAEVGPWEPSDERTQGPFLLDLPQPKWMGNTGLSNETRSHNSSEFVGSQVAVNPLEEAILKEVVYAML